MDSIDKIKEKILKRKAEALALISQISNTLEMDEDGIKTLEFLNTFMESYQKIADNMDAEISPVNAPCYSAPTFCEPSFMLDEESARY